MVHFLQFSNNSTNYNASLATTQLKLVNFIAEQSRRNLFQLCILEFVGLSE